MKNYDIVKVNTPDEYSILCPLISGFVQVSDCEKCVYHLSAGVDYKEDLLGNIDFDNYSQWIECVYLENKKRGKFNKQGRKVVFGKKGKREKK